jgi:hypothetical protein
MEEQKLTEEQIAQLKKLRKREVIFGAKLGLKVSGMYIVASLIITLLDFFYVHSQPFVFVSSFITGIAIFNSMASGLKARRTELEQEIKKILEIK